VPVSAETIPPPRGREILTWCAFQDDGRIVTTL
jgi:hypothetical protein